MTTTRTVRYHTGRIEQWEETDPSTFTPAQCAAHARIYAETGSLIAARCAGLHVADDGQVFGHVCPKGGAALKPGVMPGVHMCGVCGERYGT